MGDGLDVHETTAGVKQNTAAARRADITAGSAGGPPNATNI